MNHEVPGETVEIQAVRVAGALAELGVREVMLIRGGLSKELNTRETDLPAVLCNAPAGSRLECLEVGIVIDITAAGLAWSAADSASAGCFAARLVD
jgi:hypothetical protein